MVGSGCDWGEVRFGLDFCLWVGVGLERFLASRANRYNVSFWRKNSVVAGLNWTAVTKKCWMLSSKRKVMDMERYRDLWDLLLAVMKDCWILLDA